MKALSIKQPWASLIAHGIKDIENRTWKTNFRGRIYIHASATPAGICSNLLNDEQEIHFMREVDFKKWDKALTPSAIIGEVDIIDCVINHPSIWAEKGFEYASVDGHGYKEVYNWVLANPVLYEKPILDVKGKLSFWQTDYQHCEDCNAVEHIEKMTSIDECWTCKKCTNKLLEHYNKK